MKILITGANGQLGSELIKIISRGKSEIGAIAKDYINCEIIALDLPEFDIADASLVLNRIQSEKPDIVINCAAMTAVDACEAEKQTAMKANAIGPRNLALACNNYNAKLIHISTDYVFAGTAETPYCEWDKTSPNTVYGKSKLLGENYVREFCPKSMIIRTAWLYGYNGNNFVKTMLKLGKEKDTISVVSDQLGNPTSANDLAHHILKIALTTQYGVYHCTNNGICSWFDFTKEIFKLAGISCKVVECTTSEFPRPAPRPAFSALQNLMLESTVGDEMRPWQEAIGSYIANL